MGDSVNLTKEEFVNKYCNYCGSQRCEGFDSIWLEGCRHWKRENGTLNLIEKAMENKGIKMILPKIYNNADDIRRDFEPKEIPFNIKEYYRWCRIELWGRHNLFESMTEEVEC